MAERCREDVMSDLKADWWRWDSGRKDRRRVYRVRDDLPGPSAPPSRRRIISANVSPVIDHRASYVEGANMGIIVGPVLKHPEGYGFDVWTVTKGVIPGYPYRRIEDAYYARNAEIRASAQGRAPGAIVCQTLDEFIVKSNGCETLAAA
jgi:hypothetical protein